MLDLVEQLHYSIYASDCHQHLGQGCKDTGIPIPISLWQLLLKESEVLTIMRPRNTNFPLIVSSSPIIKERKLLSLRSLEPVLPF